MWAWQAENMSWGMFDPADVDDRAARIQVLAFVDEFCRGMTLRDAREWYVQAFADGESLADSKLP